MTTHRRLASASAIVLVAVTAACASDPGPQRTEPAKVTFIPASSPSAAAPASGPFDVVIGNLPAKLAIDGKLDEWPVPASSRSARRAFVAIGSEKLVLGVAWSAAPKDGVMIAVSSPVPALPEIGWTQRGGSTHELNDERCRFEQVALAEANWENGPPHPPEVVAACRGLLERQAAFTTTFRERYVRRFRITADGVQAVDAAGAVTPIAGAEFRASPEGAEVGLPLAAMPTFSQAPLLTVLAAAAEGRLPATLVPPAGQEDDGWSRADLKDPVLFGPYRPLLEQVMANYGMTTGTPMAQGHFHPATADRVSVIHPSEGVAIGGKSAPDRAVLVETEDPLFVKGDELGDVVTGISVRSFFVTMRKGKLITFESFPDVRGVKRRGETLHVFGYQAGGFNPFVGTYIPPVWRAIAVKSDGTITDLADEGVDYIGFWNAWDDDPKPFFDPEFKAFGMKGKRNKRDKTVTWRWDEKSAKYVSAVTPANQAPSTP